MGEELVKSQKVGQRFHKSLPDAVLGNSQA
jgi:hypothetical protein